MGTLLLAAILFVSLNLHAQLSIQSAQPVGEAQLDSVDSLPAIVADAYGLEPVGLESLPVFAGTFWVAGENRNSVLPPPPYPGLMPQFWNCRVWRIAGNSYLVDASNGEIPDLPSPLLRRSATLSVQAAVEAQGNALADLIEQLQDRQMLQDMAMMFGMELPSFEGEGGGSYSPNEGSYFSAVDYGTNLWVLPLGVTNGLLAGNGMNTLADVPYEIQSLTNLLQTNWQSEGFVYGDTLTNWTALSVPANGRQNLFLRLKSWADDGSGLPIWWQQQYFGTNGVDPYGNPAGDGYSNLYKFQNGMNPNQFYTPTAPQGLTATIHQAANTATIRWLPAAGAVTNYTVEKTDTFPYPATVQNISVSAASTSYLDDISTNSPDPWNGNTYDVSYRVKANYANGSSSAWSAVVPLQVPTVTASITPGANGSTLLAVSGIPANAAYVRLYFSDWSLGALINYDTSFNYFRDIPVSAFASGIYQMTTNWPPPTTDAYGEADYAIFCSSVDAAGNASAGTFFDSRYGWPVSDYNGGLPFYDGRLQLKQNLIFKLRAAQVDTPFQFDYADDYYWDYLTAPTNYLFAGYYHVRPENVTAPNAFDALLPFAENTLFRNFVFNTGYLDANNGAINTGVGLNAASWSGNNNLILNANPTFQFQAPSGSWTNLPGSLPASSTGWLCTIPVGNTVTTDGYEALAECGISRALDVNGAGTHTFTLGTAYNLFGLQFSSAKIVSSAGTGYSVSTLNANSSLTFSQTLGCSPYAGAVAPTFQIAKYDFWQPGYQSLPGHADFSPTNQSQLLVTAVGDEFFQVAGYAKLEVANSYYSDVYAYLGQYFDTAYKATNGVATATPTGVLSPYGNFFATEPGAVALVTMSDLDTGQRGTSVVHCVSLQVDKNHDGVMDLTFNGTDATSQENPMVCWINNGGMKMDYSVGLAVDAPVPPNPPNCNAGQILYRRNLENFFRLWICGLPQLASGYQVSLSLNGVTGNTAINLYSSVETNGGIGYLTDTNVAIAQTTPGLGGPSYAIARITTNSPFFFPTNYFSGGSKYFLFEGAAAGKGQLTLTIADNEGNQIAQTGVWLDLHNIKDLYEQAHATNVTSGLPPSSLISQCVVDRMTITADGETEQVVVFVHGANITQSAYYDFTETLFKRLYWSGYHGKVAGFKWPCAYLPFENTINPFNYNKSEFYAWKSASALRVYLNSLRNRSDLTNYTINILAHSQGNVVASEAVKQGAAFDNYILTQGAIPAQCYDTSVPFLQKFLDKEATSPTPLNTTNGGYHGYFSGITGNLINFYNTNDYALAQGTWLGHQANWEENQVSQKPESFVFAQQYGYAPNTGVSIRYYGGIVTGDVVTDTYEIMSMVARSRTRAIGAENNAAGVVQSSVDLQTTFDFGKAREEHSAQFTRNIQTVLSYYQTILNRIQPPQ